MTIDEHPLPGWRLERIEHRRQIGTVDNWFASVMRLRDGAVIAYVSPVSLASAYTGCMISAREEDEKDDR